jgi:hypothetical protein
VATKVRSILNRVAAILNDEEFVRWEESELLEWLNDGQRVIARGPATDVYVVRDNITATAGTVQSMPSDVIRLIDVVKNVSDGSAIYQSDYATVDMLSLTWRSAATDSEEVYFYDERNPKQFEVYPPQAGGELIEVVYNAQPANATILGNITIDDMYADALIDYMAYRALSKDTEDTGLGLKKATAYYRAFLLSAGFKDAADALIEPGRS